MPETIAVVTDLHLEPGDDTVFERFADRLSAIESYSPDRLVVLGDIVHYATDGRDRELVERFVSLLDDSGLAYRCLPGNHDLGRLDLAAFTDAVGNDGWTVEEETETWFLDSTAPHLGERRSEVSDDQVQALAERLPAMASAVLFVHHPVHYHDIRDNRWFGEHPEEAFPGNKRAVAETLSPGSVGAVLNGHLHEFAVTEYQGVLHVSVDAFNKTNNPDGTTGNFAVVERGDPLCITHVGGDGTEHVVRWPVRTG